MKQTLLLTLSFFAITSFIIASTDKFIDKMAVVGSPGLSSEPCAAIDKKLIKLNDFTTMVNNTSAFHLEEKAAALTVPGITVSNNKKKMLRDAKKKYAEYATEREKYGCDTSMSASTDKMAIVAKPSLSSDRSAAIDKKPMKQDEVTTKISNTSTNKLIDKIAVIGSPGLSSDPCAAIDKKLIKLNDFTTMVNNTSAFHLEEKAAALPVPGITVSNNKKKMLRDAKKKYAKYATEREKYGCDTPIPTATVQTVDKIEVVSKPVDSLPAVQASVIEEKPTALPVPAVKSSNNKEQTLREAKKKDAEVAAERQNDIVETPMTASTTPKAEKMAIVDNPTVSSDQCDAIDKKLIKLYEFKIMVNSTSAFHLEEKAAALPVPGITVSNNKKKMLRDAEKKGVELLAERQKYGCEPLTN